MERRTFLKGAAGAGLLGASGGFAAPALSQGAAARTLRFVPQANLANFDPIWGTQYVVRNASAMVWDTLYGVDESLTPQPQMVEGDEVSSDGLTWTFKLRSGMRFHDNEPVLAKDVVASITRWMPRDPMGQMIKALQQELVAVDDRTVPPGAEEALPEDALRLRQGGHAHLLHHARADRQDRQLHPDQRLRRQRPDAVSCGTNGFRAPRRCSRSSTAIAARRECRHLAFRRQAHDGGPRRVAHHARPGDRIGRAAERRDRLVGEPDHRSRAAAAPQPRTSRSTSPIRWATSAASA